MNDNIVKHQICQISNIAFFTTITTLYCVINHLFNVCTLLKNVK